MQRTLNNKALLTLHFVLSVINVTNVVLKCFSIHVKQYVVTRKSIRLLPFSYT